MMPVGWMAIKGIGLNPMTTTSCSNVCVLDWYGNLSKTLNRINIFSAVLICSLQQFPYLD